MNKRILIIGADMRNATDLIRAHRLIHQFLEEFSDRFGRYNHVAYGREDTVVVWQTANQITVRFCR